MMPAAVADAPAADISLYVHWPFCRSKCPYCDFNSHVREDIDEDRWRWAYLSELAFFAAMTRGRRVISVFFGGGTPSLMAPQTASAILDAVAWHWTVARDAEVTLEANPTTAEAGRFTAFRLAGINRLSIGVQSFDDQALRFLGRGHSAAEARAAVAIAAATVPRFSFDLIYARPGQTCDAWQRDLNEALARAGDHLSAYQLTIEPGTAFHWQRVETAPESTAADLFEMTQERLAAAGLPAYEISNHARTGAACRHNLAIWQGGDYAGIGPGAHGRLTLNGVTATTRQLGSPERWLARVEAEGSGLAGRTALSGEERREELILLGLRLSDGIDRHRFRVLAGIDVLDTVNGIRLADLVEAGYLTLDAERLAATAVGRQRLNAVIAALLA